MRTQYKKKSFLSLCLSAVFLCAAFIFLVQYQGQVARFVAAKGNTAKRVLIRVRAALSSVSLNGGTTTLDDAADLTSSADLGSDIGAYNWTVSGNRLMALNMPFNSSAVTQTDFSGGSHNGAVTGATPTTSGCKVGSCMTFDGNDYIDIPTSPDWDFADTITISVWAKRNSGTPPMAALGVGGSAYTALMWLSGDGSTFDSAGIYIHTSSSTEYSVGCTPALGSLWNGTWQHVVGVYDRSLPSNQLRMYINGVLCGSATVANEALLPVGANGVEIGRWPESTSYLTGVLDEVQIYKRALSAEQIAQLYADGNAGLGAPTVIAAEETEATEVWNLSITPISGAGVIGSPMSSGNTVTIDAGETGPLSAVSLNNGVTTIDYGADLTVQTVGLAGDIGAFTYTHGSNKYMAVNLPFRAGATQTDFSGNGYNGTAAGNAAYTTSDCLAGGCFIFDGIDDYVTLPSTEPFVNLSALSISAWVNYSGAGDIINNHYHGSTWESYYLTTSNFILNSSNSGATRKVLNYTAIPTDSDWHHVVATWDGANMNVYVDGTHNAGPLAFTGTPWASSRLPYIGASASLSAPPVQGELTGKIDELQIYRHALSAEQIAQLYTDGQAGRGGPTVINNVPYTGPWDLTVTPITLAGSLGTPVASSNTVSVTGALPSEPPPGTDLCAAGGQAADDILNADETDFDMQSVTIKNCTFTINGAHTFSNIVLGDGGGTNDSVLNHTATTTSTIYKSDLTVTGTVWIKNDGMINLDGRGFPATYTSNGAGGLTTVGGTTVNGGGSHGGYGTGNSGQVYGSIIEPSEPGAGGSAHAGGGYMKLQATNLMLGGIISANGINGGANGGSAGGGLWITITDSVSGSGTIRANGGGPGSNNCCGGGGGGRVAFYYNDAYPGNDVLEHSIQAYGGAGNAGLGTLSGAPGTVYLKKTAANEDTVIIDANSPQMNVSLFTPLPSTPDFDEILIRNKAIVEATTITTGSLNLSGTATLRHPATTTSTVYRLDITADSVSIDSTSTINLDGRGFPATYTSNGAGGLTTVGGTTANGGGSHGGYGTGNSGQVYGSIIEPTEPGAGGSAHAGGGYMKLDATSLTISGIISANGITGGANGGSAGGGLWITITDSVSGSGTIRANGGGPGSNNCCGGGGGGRVAFYYNDAYPGNDVLEHSIQAYGGAGNPSLGTLSGAPGTVYLKQTAADEDTLIIDANSPSSNVGLFTPLPSTPVFDEILIRNKAIVEATTITTGSLALTGAATLRHPATTTSTVYRLDITGDSVSIDSTSVINLDGRGFTAGRTSDGAGGQTTVGGAAAGQAGSHGGRGYTASSSLAYGSLTEPVDPGAGSGAHVGGGYLKITAGSFTHNGIITANGNGGGSNPGAAGGGVWISSTGQVSGTGTIRATGGSGSNTNCCGAGGGGRIALYYDGSLTGNDVLEFSIQAYGSTNAFGMMSNAGTIYLKDSTQTYGDLVVSNNNLNATTSNTPLFVTVPAGSPTNYTFRNVSVTNRGRLMIGAPCDTSGPALTVSGTRDLSGNGLIIDTSSGTCVQSFAAVNITPSTLTAGVVGESYTATLTTPGQLPFSWQCLDAIGGNVVTCSTTMPSGLSLGAANGIISGTPSTAGAYNFVVRVTDGASATDSETISLTVGQRPDEPVLVQPADGATVTVLRPTLYATYDDADAGDVGYTQYRISSGSVTDCVNGLQIVVSGNSNVTATNSENTSWTSTVDLVDLQTYAWCARNNDQVLTSNNGAYTPMGSFMVEKTSGSSSQIIQQKQQQTQEQYEAEQQQLVSPPTAETELPIVSTIPAPTITIATVLDHESIRYEWTYGNTSDILGFRLLDGQNSVTVQVESPVAIAATEDGLPHNTLVSGRTVAAYSQTGQSAPSAAYMDEYTHMIPVTPTLVSRRNGQITVKTVETLNNLTDRLSGVQFELLAAETGAGAQVMIGEWSKNTEYTFTGIKRGADYMVRVRARNAIGVETVWSSTVSIPPDETEPMPDLSVSLYLSPIQGGVNLDQPVNVNTIVNAEIVVKNIGTGYAENVLVRMPIPKYLTFFPDTVSVDSRLQTDIPDGDFAQARNGVVSAIWGIMQPQESHYIRVQLGFDAQLLIQDFLQNLDPDALVENPVIFVQAEANHADDEELKNSSVRQLIPDLGLLRASLQPEQQEEIPLEPEVPLLTPEETEIIERVLEEEFGVPPSTLPPSSAQPQAGETPAPSTTVLERGATNSSSGGGSFNIDVTSGSGGTSLGLTGSAQTVADQIQFSGTTTQPFTIITLILNDSITAIAVSDAQGYWQTYVSAERLGITAGQEARVKIEAIAAKGTLRSERVSVGEVTVSRGRSGNVQMEFERAVSESIVVTAVEEIRKEVVAIVERQEPVIQTTLSVAAPVVVVSSVPLWGYLPYAPTLIYHAITYAVGLIGRKKRVGARFYGVAYDSITKQPLALAIIRVYKVEPTLSGAANIGAAAATNKKLVTTIVTDKQGRYDALLEPGTYQLEVSKPQYLFPSQIVSTQIDGDFQHVYNAGAGIQVQGDQITIPDVPLDPINSQRQWQLATGPKKLWYAVQNVGNYLAAPILIVGAITSAVVVAVTPDKLINWIIAAFYIVLLALQLRLRHKVEKAWGVVYDIATNAVLPLTTVQLIEPASSKVVTSRLSDYQGRFAFLPEPGTYVIKASKPGYQQVSEVIEAPQTDRAPLRGEIIIEKSDQRISGDVAMRKEG